MTAPTRFTPADGWGPGRKRAALALTFDNFGEASDIELGFWGDKPVGDHFAVRWLPELIDMLGDFRATYFIEASNAAIYPDQIRNWHKAGHEVGIHAWRHEIWNKTPSERRKRLLSDSIAAMRSIGIEPVGFRPPGGSIPSEAWDEFAEAGFLYCSDAGEAGIKQVGTMLALPFEWPDVDAYMMHEALGFMRVQFGHRDLPYTPSEWEASLNRSIDTLMSEGGQRTIIFHPTELAGKPERIAVLQRLIDRLRASPDVWIAPAADIARFARDQIDAGVPA